MHYFERLDAHRFVATEHTGGAWDVTEQHVSPLLGLLAHATLLDRESRRDDPAVLGRVSFDILGTVPVGEVELHVDVLRPGRTIELVEARASHAGRVVVRARVWLLHPYDTSAIAGSSVEPMPARSDLEPWDPTTVWPGGCLATLDVRRDQVEPGRARLWLRARASLLADEPVSDAARLVGLLDFANGMTVRQDPRTVAFPNIDLTAHLVRPPSGEWLGLDTHVSFGPGGVGVTHSRLHDVDGFVGTSAQSLTIRP